MNEVLHPAKIDADAVRAARMALGLSASEAANLVGLNDGAAWRKWERNGVTGSGAVLLRAMIESAAVRRYFGLNLMADSTRKSG